MADRSRGGTSEYCRQNGIPLKGGTSESPYSIDDNLWGRSSEGKIIEKLDTPPTDDVEAGHPARRGPDEPEYVTADAKRADRSPSTANAARTGAAAGGGRRCGGRHGCGIVDHIEDRIVGLKVRDIYEVPAAALGADRPSDLEKVV
ncbi:MAG: argininosuccinate synthase [Thermoleophilales bacterium]|nr:argininosuccinate synthase [Thermoleophilales bacterium]